MQIWLSEVLCIFLRIWKDLVDSVLNFAFERFYGNTHLNLPPIKTPLLTKSVVQQARNIREGTITSEQLLSSNIQRIKDVNPILNCVVDNRFDLALAEARAIDARLLVMTEEERRALFEEKPFLGIPFTIKDCFEVEGLSWTAGLWYRRNEKGCTDAPVVRAMKSAGCIMLAVTNVSELCMWMESNNKVYGRSNNPYHTGRTVGGSSGGEGCVISAGGSGWGVGSDVGGSIRMPAFFNGIFGHKPSTGIVENAGQLPKAYGVINTYLVTGPMCRFAEDLAPMLKILAKPETLPRLKLDAPVNLSQVKVYYLEDDGGFPLITSVHPELRRAQARLLDTLTEELGVTVTKAELPNMFYSLPIWTESMASEPSMKKFSAELVQLKGEINPWLELVSWLLGRSLHTLPALLLAVGEKFIFKESSLHKHFVNLGEQLRDELQSLLGEDGVLIYPSHPTPAPYHNLPVLRTLNFAYTGIFNILGNPVTQVPLGLDSAGVPLGVQIVGGRDMDRLCLALAAVVEDKLGGWVPPSQVRGL